MMGEILLLALGALLAVLGALLWKKGAARSWTASLAAAGILLLAAGGWLAHGQMARRQADRENVYLGLKYIECSDQYAARIYLKKVKNDSYVSAAARYLMEQIWSNSLTARLNRDIAASLAKSEEEKNLLAALDSVPAQGGDLEQLPLLVGQLQERLRLSQARMDALDAYARAEQDHTYTLDEETLRAAGLDRNSAARLSIGAMLRNGNFSSAVRAAVALVDEKPSEENRLLLAEAVAESAGAPYNQPLCAEDFAAAGGEPDPSAGEEREALAARQSKVESELLTVETALGAASDEAEIQRLSARRLELAGERKELARRSDKLYVYRAFSALADLHSLEAELVRARLYYALEDYGQAVETLRKAARSARARITPDQTLANSLRILEETYSSSEPFYESQEFEDAMVNLLSAPFPDLMQVSRASLTQEFAGRIVSDQKSYGRGLAVSALDVSGYPTVRVTLTGREELLRQVAEQRDVSAKDTRQEIRYTAVLNESAVSDICIVADRSGSMGGAPMEHLKSALDTFIRSAREGMSLSLVAFDGRAELIAERTQDKIRLLSAVETLGGSGGTEITAGIRGGMEALEEAAGGQIMLLMTDGQSSVDFSAVEEAAARGITIHTIGFGDVNDALLEEIAERTGGQYVKADDASELNNVYASLQELIGTAVTLEYAAPEADRTESRYFFLSLLERYSVRREYRAGEEEAVPQIYACNPAVVSPDDLQRMSSQGSRLNLTLTGTHLTDVEELYIGGQAAEILDKQDDTLRAAAGPGLGEGWQTVSVICAGGEERMFDRVLLVGQPERCRNVRLGSILIPSAQGVRPGDGTLVLLGSFGVREYGEDGERGSLDLTLSGVLTLPWQDQPEDVLREGVTDLGSQGTGEGWGLVTVNRSDGAYAGNGPAVAARGGLRLECGPEQSRLVQAEEAAE